jgi:hypothetical protein
MASRRRELTQVSGLDTAASGKPSQRFALPKGVSFWAIPRLRQAPAPCHHAHRSRCAPAQRPRRCSVRKTRTGRGHAGTGQVSVHDKGQFGLEPAAVHAQEAAWERRHRGVRL